MVNPPIVLPMLAAIIVLASYSGVPILDQHLVVQSPEDTQSKVKRIVFGAVHELRLAPAVVAAVVGPDGTHMAVAGDAGRPDGQPLDFQTLFDIGSITKVLTGVLLADMLHAGEVTNETTIGALLPSSYQLDPAVASITLIELATHTSGLPAYPIGPMLYRQLVHPTDPYAGSSREELWKALARVSSRTMAGRGSYAYSNLGMAVLGRLLETPGGGQYEKQVSERILLPLGMSDAVFNLDQASYPRMASGFRANGRPAPLWNLDAYAPAGGLRASLTDMSRFLEAAVRQHPPSVALSQTPFWTSPDGSQTLGLGWGILQTSRGKLLAHDGESAGYRSVILVAPDSGRGVMVLANSTTDLMPLAVTLLFAPDRPLRRSDPGFTAKAITVAMSVLPVVLMIVCWWWLRSRTSKTGRGVVIVALGIFAATLLAYSWQFGAWQVVPHFLWWFGVSATCISFAACVPISRRQPFWLTTPIANRLCVGGTVLLFAASLWVIFLHILASH